MKSDHLKQANLFLILTDLEHLIYRHNETAIMVKSLGTLSAVLVKHKGEKDFSSPPPPPPESMLSV